MSAPSRREFGQTVAALLPFAIAGTRLHARAGLVLGATTASFRDLPRVKGQDNIEDVIRALRTAGVKHIDLAFANIEPAPPSTAPFIGGSQAYPKRVVLSPEEVASTNAEARAALRTWRLETPLTHFEHLRATLAGAGLTVHACSLVYDASFTDEEITATMRQAQALGVTTIGSPMTHAMAERIVPFAERHGVRVAIHNQVDGNTANQIGGADLDAALSLSPALRVKLDVGHLTASDRDAVDAVTHHASRLASVVVRDRLHHGGASQAFGEGDTPIAGVLDAVRRSAAPVPVLAEYDYPGLRPAADEVAAAMAYLTRQAG